MHYPFPRWGYYDITLETSAALYNDRCLFSFCNRNARNSRNDSKREGRLRETERRRERKDKERENEKKKEEASRNTFKSIEYKETYGMRIKMILIEFELTEFKKSKKT